MRRSPAARRECRHLRPSPSSPASRPCCACAARRHPRGPAPPGNRAAVAGARAPTGASAPASPTWRALLLWDVRLAHPARHDAPRTCRQPDRRCARRGRPRSSRSSLIGAARRCSRRGSLLASAPSRGADGADERQALEAWPRAPRSPSPPRTSRVVAVGIRRRRHERPSRSPRTWPTLTRSASPPWVGIVRYGLFDLRAVLSRSIAYGVLAAVVVVVYATTSAALDEIVAGALPAVVAAALAAVAVLPLHERVQRSVNRRIFGLRNDPAAAFPPARPASRWGRGSRRCPSARGSTRSPRRSGLRYVSIEVEGTQLARSGAPVAGPLLQLARLPFAGQSDRAPDHSSSAIRERRSAGPTSRCSTRS